MNIKVIIIKKIIINLKIEKKLDKNKNICLNESYDDIKGLKDVKSIMENMKANKIKLKEVINEHFGKEAFQ